MALRPLLPIEFPSSDNLVSEFLSLSAVVAKCTAPQAPMWLLERPRAVSFLLFSINLDTQTASLGPSLLEYRYSSFRLSVSFRTSQSAIIKVRPILQLFKARLFIFGLPAKLYMNLSPLMPDKSLCVMNNSFRVVLSLRPEDRRAIDPSESSLWLR